MDYHKKIQNNERLICINEQVGILSEYSYITYNVNNCSYALKKQNAT